MKEILIIVPGAKPLKSKNHILQKIILDIYGLLSFHPCYRNNEFKDLIKDIKKKNRKIIYLNWTRKVADKDIIKASERLVELLCYYKKYKIKIFAFSMGAKISQLALNKLKEQEIEILLQIGAFNNQKKISNAKRIINIYSDKDRLVKVGMDLLEPFKVSQIVHGKNVKNIDFSTIEHEDFFDNKLIKFGKYKGKKLFQLYKEFLS